MVTFSKGVRDEKRGELADKFGVREVDVHDLYLGLPTVVGRSKKVITRGVKEKLWKKMQGWKGMVLSEVGMEVMIKAVAQYLPSYAKSVFKFPSSFCDEMRSVVDQFWWGKNKVNAKFIGLLGRSCAARRRMEDRILSIPIRGRLPIDRLCWDIEKNGEYSVKSAYRALFDDDWKSEEEASSPGHSL
ncbi:uncharacterized protein LOC110711544 [Chenopodium quinoa]|uniref:uncharacterized protein LOC110711544 n=1 Tax=Chenopodium quinoa TaxID=63459 RepID=UPI000B79878F|nr:uncharacterized protein LOC110711544 [Chenopodium quinoa]